MTNRHPLPSPSITVISAGRTALLTAHVNAAMKGDRRVHAHMRDPDSAHTDKDEGPARITRAEMLNHLQALRQALWEQGFDVGISYPVLTARNSAVEGEGDVGKLLCPGLSQKIVVECRDGQPWFSWVWPPPRKSHRDAAPGASEYEPLCPASDIAEAAARVAKVIQLREETPDA